MSTTLMSGSSFSSAIRDNVLVLANTNSTKRSLRNKLEASILKVAGDVSNTRNDLNGYFQKLPANMILLLDSLDKVITLIQNKPDSLIAKTMPDSESCGKKMTYLEGLLYIIQGFIRRASASKALTAAVKEFLKPEASGYLQKAAAAFNATSAGKSTPISISNKAEILKLLFEKQAE